MSTISQYRPSKRPSVKQVQTWDILFQDTVDLSWRGLEDITCRIEQGYPFPDFYRVTTWQVGVGKKSKLFYGERAHSQVEMFVYDLGFRNVLGVI